MAMEQLIQFETMNEVQQINAVASILRSNDFQEKVYYSRGSHAIANYCYVKQGVPYVFIVIVNNNKGYTAFNFINYDIYVDLVVNKHQVFRAEVCHDRTKYSVQFGGANVRVHSYILPQAEAVDHASGHKSLNIREMLRPCTPSENMKNVLRYCTVDKKTKSFCMKDPGLSSEERIKLGNMGFKFKSLARGNYIYSPRYNTLGECYTTVNQFERHYFKEFAFNPLYNFEYTWYAVVLQKMLGTFSNLQLVEYNRSYWIRRRPEDAEYYML